MTPFFNEILHPTPLLSYSNRHICTPLSYLSVSHPRPMGSCVQVRNTGTGWWVGGRVLQVALRYSDLHSYLSLAIMLQTEKCVYFRGRVVVGGRCDAGGV